jgi:hypothetical protein
MFLGQVGLSLKHFAAVSFERELISLKRVSKDLMILIVSFERDSIKIAIQTFCSISHLNKLRARLQTRLFVPNFQTLINIGIRNFS